MSLRLPRNYTPKKYELFLHITPQQHPFEASVTITFDKNEDSDKAYLYAYTNIQIKSIIQNDVPLTYTIEYPLLTINRSTDPDQDISSNPITINYTVTPITTEYQGFYPYNDGFFTKFEPNHAHRLLPCFDDPIVKSTFSVKVRIPSNLMGLSNMPIESTTSIDDETEINFHQTPPMCTYLLAIFVDDFDMIEGLTKSGTPVKFYSKRGSEDIFKKYLDAAIHAVNWMEEKTKVKYELPVLQLVSHPGLKTGMENYGLIALRDYSNSYDVVYDTLVVMHEVSHLWFGDLVSVKWWNSVWLNEGFAQYLMYVILRDFSEKYSNKAIQIFIKNDGMRCINFFDDGRIVVDEDEINFNERVLKSIIYIKGAFVLKMFSDIVGEENFFKVCSNWMCTFKNKCGDVDQFIQLANNTLNEDYSDFFNTWLKNVGFPMLDVVELYGENDEIVGIRLIQKSCTDAIYQFKISILYESDGELNEMDVLMKEKQEEFMFKYDWVIVNNGMESLCAVIYSKVLINKLCQVQNSRKISQLNKWLIKNSVQCVSNLFDIDDDILNLIHEHLM